MNIKIQKAFMICMGIMVGIGLAVSACGKQPDGTSTTTPIQTGMSDSETVIAVYNSLAVLFATGDNADSVTGNVTLPVSGTNDATISWSSDHTNVISSEGTVTRPASGSGNITVNLTASIVKNTAGTNQIVRIGDSVALSGTATDLNGDTLSYLWEQTSGTTVTISNADTSTPSFTAPSISGNLVFTLYVSDGELSNSDTVTISVQNQAPTADAGTNQIVLKNINIQLSGITNDSDGNMLSFIWEQTGGEPVILSNDDTLSPSFTSPTVIGDLTFDLIVSDSELSATDSVTITVVPYFETKLIASDGGIYEYFGNSVGISSNGQTVVVGADRTLTNIGSVYVYQKNGDHWDETKLNASDASNSDYFGYSSAISGDGQTILVGAYGDQAYQGAAYIYKRNGDNWVETKLTASDGSAGDYYGYGISLSYNGQIAVVGAWRDNSFKGAIYIYKWNGVDWDETKLIASDAVDSGYFGIQVSVSGDGNTLITGSYPYNTYQGKGYIYRWNGVDWDETIIYASDGATGDQFGSYVTLSGDGETAIIGAYGDDDAGNSSGSVYIYNWNGASWDEDKISASDGEGDEIFGSSVSASYDGETLLVGANQDTVNGYNSGSAYIYEWSGSSWDETKIIPSDSTESTYFGNRVAISGSGNIALIGCNRDDDNGTTSGSAYIYTDF